MAKNANTTPPQEDNFDYASIENHMYAPDTELTIFGAEMMQLKGRLEKFLHDNTQAVLDLITNHQDISFNLTLRILQKFMVWFTVLFIDVSMRKVKL